MAAVLVIICAILIFIPLAKQEHVTNELQSVIKGIRGIINFIESDYQNLNVDGLYGLRVLEGHLEGLLIKHSHGELQHLDSSVVPQLKVMKEKATNISAQALIYVKKEGQMYYRQMSYVVNNPWSLFNGNRQMVNMSLAWPIEVYQSAKTTVFIDEKTSDTCMSELVGTHKSQGSACDISSKCAHTMTAPGLLGYALTHQILWTMLAEKAGCTEKLQARLFELQRGDLRSLREELCSNNYIQLQETLQKLPARVIIPALQDLFLEQMFICPSLGFFEFLELEFLDQILSWQYDSGCFGKMKRTNLKGLDLGTALTGPEDDDYVEEEGNGDLKFQKNIKDIKASGLKAPAKLPQKPRENKQLNVGVADWQMAINKGRKLLVEKKMSGGCLAHKTAVASGALVMFLRYLCEPDAAKLFGAHRKYRSAEPAVDIRKQGGEDLVKVKNSDVKNLDKQEVPSNGDPIEKLHFNLKKEAEYPNSLERLKKFKNAYKEHKEPLNIHKGDGQQPLPQPIKENPGNKNNGLKMDKNKDDDNYDYKYDDNDANGGKAGNNKNDQDDYEDEEGEDDDKEEEEYEDDNLKDYEKRGDGEIDRNLNEYYDENEKDKENQDIKNRADNDNDDDYNADDGYNDGYHDNDKENVHPHIHARNIGIGKSQDYDKGYEEDKRLKQVKDYDDDEDGDDYEYDDDDAEMEQRRREEVKNELFLANPNKKEIDSHRPSMAEENISEHSMLTTTSCFIMLVSALILIILYRFLKKKRLRLRLGHKHFHV